jgi:hypothetical protein
MLPYSFLCRLSKFGQGFCILDGVGLVTDEKQSIGLLAQRIHTPLALPWDATTAESSAGTLIQMPLRRLVAERK